MSELVGRISFTRLKDQECLNEYANNRESSMSIEIIFNRSHSTYFPIHLVTIDSMFELIINAIAYTLGSLGGTLMLRSGL